MQDEKTGKAIHMVLVLLDLCKVHFSSTMPPSYLAFRSDPTELHVLFLSLSPKTPERHEHGFQGRPSQKYKRRHPCLTGLVLPMSSRTQRNIEPNSYRRYKNVRAICLCLLPSLQDTHMMARIGAPPLSKIIAAAITRAWSY
jgi:hypothetical protein